MPNFQVNGMYELPEWWTVEIEAEDEIEAEEKALAEMKIASPEEAHEFEIIDVKELD